MPTREIRELRLKYRQAFTRYMRPVLDLSDVSATPTAPPARLVAEEMGAWEVLVDARTKLLRALRTYYLNREAANSGK